MTFSIDFVVTHEKGPKPLADLAGAGGLPEDLPAVRDMTGHMALVIDGRPAPATYDEPMLRLVDLFLRKVPWIVGGDTETVALRNSEHCYAFVPAGHSVEVSFYAGTESEIEDALGEPATVRTDAFVGGVIAMGERVLALCGRVGTAAGGAVDDPLRDLEVSLGEAKAAWHDHQLHQRR